VAGGAGVFSLSAAEFGTIHDGTSGILVGRSNGSHTVTLGGPLTLTDNLTLRGNVINLGANALNVGANDLTFNIGQTANGTFDLTNLNLTAGTVYVNGGNFDDTITSKFFTFAQVLDGGAGTDTLDFDPTGTAMTIALSPLTAAGKGSVAYSHFENFNFHNLLLLIQPIIAFGQSINPLTTTTGIAISAGKLNVITAPNSPNTTLLVAEDQTSSNGIDSDLNNAAGDAFLSFYLPFQSFFSSDYNDENAFAPDVSISSNYVNHFTNYMTFSTGFGVHISSYGLITDNQESHP
jgi:hypothetical protein